MFGMGIPEIIVVVVVALVLVNPRDLPVIVRKIGKAYVSVMRQINGMRKTCSQFEHEVKSLTEMNNKE